MQKHWRAAVTFLGLLGVLSAAGPAKAQVPLPFPPAESRAFQVPVQGMAGPDVIYLSAGPMWEAKTVIDAPYSAEAVSESRQILADGNVIDHKDTSRIYRDSAGRVRRETNRPGMLGIGPRVFGFAQTAGEGAQQSGAVTVQGNAGGPEVMVRTAAGPVTLRVRGTITIYDPVAHASFLLEPGRKIAYEMMRPPPGITRFRAVMNQDETQHKSDVTSQSLGARTFDGVMAYGTRSTMVIPAGTIGNEKPITVISDRWYSPKLQINVMTQHDDPRFGVITYRLTNIKVGEPSEALFKVPNGYTIKRFPLKPRMPEPEQFPPK